MAIGNIVTVGASAGRVEALTKLVAGLPANLPSAVFVVLHIGNGPGSLPEILARAGPLPAVHAAHGETIVEGKVYVAPPDCHS